MSSQIEEYLRKYVHLVELADAHPLKLMYLSEMFKEVFGISIEDLAPGVEKNLGSRIMGVRGKADLLFSEVVLEIKTDFEEEIEDAKAQLAKYLQALHELRPTKKQIGITTDGIRFMAFMPMFDVDKITGLREISSIDMRK